MEKMHISLTGLIEKYEKDFPFHFKLSILMDTCQGIQFLHSQNIIHRNLSSNNILLSRHIVAKVADLGVAKVVSPGLDKYTQAPCTIAFMPPEALSVKPVYGPSIDVFSVGCVCVHVVSLQWPLPSDRVTANNVVLSEVQRRESYFTTFTQLPELKQLVEQCLQNKPEERPVIGEVITGLKNVAFDHHPREGDSVIELFKYAVSMQSVDERIVQKDQQLMAKDNQLVVKDQQLSQKDQQLGQKDLHLRQKDQEITDKHQQLTKRDQQLSSKDELLSQKDEQLRQKDQQVHQLVSQKDQQLREKDQQLREKDHVIVEKDEQLRGKDQQLVKKDQEIAKKDQQLSEKDEQLRQKDQQLEQKDQMIIEKDQQLSYMQKMLKDNDQNIKEKDVLLSQQNSQGMSYYDTTLSQSNLQLGKKSQESKQEDGIIHKDQTVSY